MNSKPKLLFINVEINYAIKGTIRKAFAQYNALQELFAVDFLSLKPNPSNRWIRAFSFYLIFPISVLLKALINKDCFIYYRYYPHNLFLNLIIYSLKNYNNIYIEVNTKYRHETKITTRWFYLSNILSEKLVYQSAKAVLPVTRDFGNYVLSIYSSSRVIVLGNGYDPVEYDKKDNSCFDDLKEALKKGKNKKKLVWVGTPVFWHGLDKIISIFSQLDDVCLYLVGTVNNFIQARDFQNISNQQKIFFLGERNLQELQFLYDGCDFGIGSFGLDRLNIFDGAPLKVREYLYFGLPVIIGYHDGQLDGVEFVHEYKDLYTLKNFLGRRFDQTKIKQYARDHLSWRKLMKNVFGNEITQF